MEPDSPVPDLKPGQLFINHWTDWIFIIILLVLWGVCQIVTPFQRYVGAANFVTQSIMYPYKGNTIPFQAVPVWPHPLTPLFSHYTLFWKSRISDCEVWGEVFVTSTTLFGSKIYFPLDRLSLWWSHLFSSLPISATGEMFAICIMHSWVWSQRIPFPPAWTAQLLSPEFYFILFYSNLQLFLG